MNSPANNEVVLNWSQMLQAVIVGGMRMTSDIKKGSELKYGQEGRSWDEEIESCCAECAVARHFNIFWDGAIGNYLADDVGEYQVRHTKHAAGRLILHPADKDDRIYFVVRGSGGEYSIGGWLYARDGKKPEYWENPTGKKDRDAFFVPNVRNR